MMNNLQYLPIFILPLGCIGISSAFQVLAILLFLFCLFRRKVKYNYSLFFKSSIVKKSITMIFLWIICVIIADLVSKGSLGGFKDGWNYLQRMLPFFLVGLFALNGKKFLKFALLGLCVSIFIINIDVFYNLILQDQWRPRTIFSGPNRLGAFLIMLLPFIACGIYEFKNNKKIVFIGVILLFAGILSLVISGSRGAILGLLCGSFIAFLILQLKNGNLKKICKTLLTGVILIGVIISVVSYLYPEMVNRSYDMERIYIWQSALKMIADYPLWGVGAGHFNDIYVNNGYINALAKEPHLQHPHNIFLFYFVERGILAGISFILMLLTQIYILSKNFLLSNKQVNTLVFAGLIMVFGAAIQGCVDVVMDNRTYQLMYWLLYGLSCYSIIYKEQIND